MCTGDIDNRSAPAGLRVLIRWNEATEQWRMSNAVTGKFIQEFFDCANFPLVFPGCRKDAGNEYSLFSRKVE